MRPRARSTRMLYLYCCAVIRAGETRAWNAKDYSNLPDGDRLLLWHGSRTTNFAGEHDDAQVCDGEIDGAFHRYPQTRSPHCPPGRFVSVCCAVNCIAC